MSAYPHRREDNRVIDIASMTADQVRAEAARRAARRAQNLPLTATTEEVEREKRAADDRLEAEIQAECVRHYRANGFVVYEGLKERRKTRIDKGFPDLTLFHPRTKWFGYHEVKTPTGTLRPDQRDFRDTCIATNVPHFVGGVEIAHLVIEVIQSPPSK